MVWRQDAFFQQDDKRQHDDGSNELHNEELSTGIQLNRTRNPLDVDLDTNELSNIDAKEHDRSKRPLL